MADIVQREHYIVNIGGRSESHYHESRELATVAIRAIQDAQETLGDSMRLLGKNGGLGGCMRAFGEAYEAQKIPWIPVLTEDLDTPEYAPEIARKNVRKTIEKNTTDRLTTIVKHPNNAFLLVTCGGSGTLEELASMICHNEWIIKWGHHATPVRILIIGDPAIQQWRPLLQQVFTQLADTHPNVEKQLSYLSTNYMNLLYDEIVNVLVKRKEKLN